MSYAHSSGDFTLGAILVIILALPILFIVSLFTPRRKHTIPAPGEIEDMWQGLAP